jgi:hypothetical protein
MTSEEKRKAYMKAYLQEYNKKNKEKLVEAKAIYYLKNKEKINEKNRKYHHAHKEKLNEVSKNYYYEHKEKLNEKSRTYHQENKEQLSAKNKHWREQNKEKRKQYLKENKDKLLPKIIEYQTSYYELHTEKLKEKSRLYAKENPEKMNAQKAKRKAARLQRTPTWLTQEQLKRIEVFYLEAKELEAQTGIRHHVDHIIPLRGKLVSGFHVPENLRVITASENCRKRNRYEP